MQSNFEIALGDAIRFMAERAGANPAEIIATMQADPDGATMAYAVKLVTIGAAALDIVDQHVGA